MHACMRIRVLALVEYTHTGASACGACDNQCTRGREHSRDNFTRAKCNAILITVSSVRAVNRFGHTFACTTSARHCCCFYRAICNSSIRLGQHQQRETSRAMNRFQYSASCRGRGVPQMVFIQF